MMTLDGLDGLETKIRGLLKLVQDLRQKNTSLEGEIRAVRQSLASQEELNRLWEKEHTDIESRIQKVLGDIELLELIDEPEEVSL
jgi:FtsZ-binding cell division protein ZapB